MKKYELTDEHRSRLETWKDQWIAAALRTGELSAEETGRVEAAVRGLYSVAGLPEPKHVAWAPGPITAAFAAGFAAGVIDMRERGLNDDAICASTLDALSAAELPGSAAIRGVLEQIVGPLSSAVQPDPGLTKRLLDAAVASWEMRDGGNTWISPVCELTFYRYVAKLESVDWNRFDPYEKAAIAGPRYMHRAFCIVSRLPTVLRVENGVQHAEDGPSCAWPDGRELYYWRGQEVPRAWIMDQENLDPALAIRHENAELRRVVAEIVGWEKVLRLLDARVIAEDRPIVGTLIEATVAGEPARFLRVACPTGRTFSLPVPREISTPAEAQRWVWNIDEYMPEVET